MEDQQLEVWLAMEYCRRGTLGDLIDRAGFMLPGIATMPDKATIVEVLLGLLDGAAYLHQAGIDCCYLSPTTVLLDAGPGGLGVTPKISGYPVQARGLSSPASQSVLCESGYTAPEVESGKSVGGEIADVYSLGMLAWSMFVGRRVRPGKEDLPAALASVLAACKQPVQLGALRDVIHWCIAEDATARPQSLSELR